jgi:hypothetical protein
VLILPNDHERELSLDDKALYITASGMVSASSIQVGRLRKGHYLALLLPEVDQDKVAAIVPMEIWTKSTTLQSYPSYSMHPSPSFLQVLDRSRRVPIELWHESDITKVVYYFGMYLGSLEPAMWSIHSY